MKKSYLLIMEHGKAQIFEVEPDQAQDVCKVFLEVGVDNE